MQYAKRHEYFTDKQEGTGANGMKGRAFQQNFQVGPEKGTFQQRSGKNEEKPYEKHRNQVEGTAESEAGIYVVP